jgi:glycosyltransferase involved in cell wall biosynthesis
MKISIVIPAYNAAQFLSQTIESVLAQTVQDWELVIVDDGSRDDTLAIAQTYSSDKRISVVSKQNGGVATARNFGYSHTDPHSEFFTLLDHDDLWKPDTLQLLVAALEANPTCFAVHALAQATDLQGTPNGTVHGDVRRKPCGDRMVVCTREEPTTFAMLTCHCYISTPGVSLIRRSVLQDMIKTDGYLFSQEAAPADDWQFWLRLSALGDIAYLDKVVLDWRVHESNGSLNNGATLAAEWRVRRAILDCQGLSSQQRALALYWYRRMYATALRHNITKYRQLMKTSMRERRIGQTSSLFRQALCDYSAYVKIRKFRGRLDNLPLVPSKIATEQ